MLLFSGVGHDEEPDIERLPDAVPRGVFKPVTLPTGHEPTLVMFDLETTDLSKNYNIYLLISSANLSGVYYWYILKNVKTNFI